MNPDDPPQSSWRPDRGPALDAAKQVRTPAVGLMALGGLNLLLTLASLVTLIVNPLPTTLPLEMKKAFQELRDKAQTPDEQLAVDNLARLSETLMASSMAIFAVAVVVNTCGALVLLFGGWKMSRLENLFLSRLAAFSAIAPCFMQAAPECLGACVLWPLGLLCGIWALVVLARPQVAAGFR